jgi:hypothetical protein
MFINSLSKLNMDNLLPRNMLIKEGDFIIMGLQVNHDGRGRVVVSAPQEGKLYSDSHYNSIEDVNGMINNIIELKYGNR